MTATTKLYVGNLPDKCKDDTIRDLFSPYGEVAELAVIKNYAFVHFKDEEVAKNAVRDLSGTKLLGNEISVEISKNRGNKDRGNRDRRDGSKRDGPRRDGPRRDGPRRDIPPRDKFPVNFNNNRNEDFAQNLSNLSSLLGIGGGGNLLSNPIAPMPGLGGILSTVSTLNAVAEKQKEILQSNMKTIPPLNKNDSEHAGRELTRNSGVPKSNKSGYVIYERYYVDPNHALLKGLPLPELPLAKNGFVGYPETQRSTGAINMLSASRDASRSDLYAVPSESDKVRARSPLASHREFDNGRWNPANY